MSVAAALRAGERGVTLPAMPHASVFFIGVIRTPWTARRDCPRQGDPEGPACRLELHQTWHEALEGIARHEILDVLYWMHLARRDLVLQNPKQRGDLFGTFSIRSPNRPNPIALSRVVLIAIEPDALVVKGLDCVDGTPLIDIKPSACPMVRSVR